MLFVLLIIRFNSITDHKCRPKQTAATSVLLDRGKWKICNIMCKIKVFYHYFITQTLDLLFVMNYCFIFVLLVKAKVFLIVAQQWDDVSYNHIDSNETFKQIQNEYLFTYSAVWKHISNKFKFHAACQVNHWYPFLAPGLVSTNTFTLLIIFLHFVLNMWIRQFTSCML